MDLPTDLQVGLLPVSTLAYIGDAYYELFVRERLLKHIIAKSGNLHQITIKLVNAGFQANLANFLLHTCKLDESEMDILHRGRNANPGTMAKNAQPKDYRLATGFETLVGYLYLTGNKNRINYLLADEIDKEIIEVQNKKHEIQLNRK